MINLLLYQISTYIYIYNIYIYIYILDIYDIYNIYKCIYIYIYIYQKQDKIDGIAFCGGAHIYQGSGKLILNLTGSESPPTSVKI